MAKKPIDMLKDAAQYALHRRGPAKRGSWRGVRAIRYPTDLMLYAEIIMEQKPDLIVETGTRYGGTALFLADVCRLINHGRVVSIDIDGQFGEVPQHTRLTCLRGDSVSPEIVEKVYAKAGKSALVILDSDHSPAHVAAELKAYAPLLAVGNYIIAEDLKSEGAHVSVMRFLRKNKQFALDKNCGKYGIHAGEGGFIKRVE